VVTDADGWRLGVVRRNDLERASSAAGTHGGETGVGF
jgi:hypothetical protein